MVQACRSDTPLSISGIHTCICICTYIVYTQYICVNAHIYCTWVFSSVGRASRLHREGQRFETVNTQGVQSLCTDILISISGDCAHKCTVCTICVNADIYILYTGEVAQMVRVLACHARRRGFNSRLSRAHTYSTHSIYV